MKTSTQPPARNDRSTARSASSNKVQPRSEQIAFRYRAQASASGVTRETARRLAAALGVDETQVIHLALQQLASRVLPQYQADDGALGSAQHRALKSAAPKPVGSGKVRSQLFEETA
jgi:hypothetical protein